MFEPCAIPGGRYRWTPWVAHQQATATASYFNRCGITQKTPIVPDTEMKVRIHGVSLHMNTFRYLYGIMLGELLLKHADNLSWTMQHKSRLPRMSTSGVDDRGDAQRNPGRWALDIFWTKVTSKEGTIYVGEHALSRRRKAPMRFDDRLCEGDFTKTKPMISSSHASRTGPTNLDIQFFVH